MKQPKWIVDLVETDYAKADALTGHAARLFDALFEPIRLAVLKLTLEKRKLRERLVAEKAKARTEKKELRKTIRELRAELWSHAGWQSENER